MNKKKIIVSLVLLVTLLLFLLILFLNLQSKISNLKSPSTSLLIPTPTPDPYTVNGTKKIYVDDGAPYSITANKDSSYYKILITKSPFQKYRLEAEQKLLDELKLSQKKACALDVEITTPRFANPDEAGQVYKLSFCQ